MDFHFLAELFNFIKMRGRMGGLPEFQGVRGSYQKFRAGSLGVGRSVVS